MIGGELGISNRDVCRAVDRRAAEALGGVGTAVHGDGAAAAVAADGGRGIALRQDGEIAGNGCTAAGGLNAAGIPLGGVNGGIRDSDRGPFAIAEDCVAVDGGGVDDGVRNGHIGTV